MTDLMWPEKPEISGLLQERFANSTLDETFLKFAYFQKAMGSVKSKEN